MKVEHITSLLKSTLTSGLEEDICVSVYGPVDLPFLPVETVRRDHRILLRTVISL